jgi:death-on-curing protein
MVWVPNVQVVEEVHKGLVQLFVKEEDPISPAGVKSLDLLESACTRPHTGIGGTDKYPTIYLKAAALFHSLIKNHAFHNGNKRTAFVTLLTLLNRNDRRLKNEVNDDHVYDFVLAVTANEFPSSNHTLNDDEVVSEISNWIKSQTVPSRSNAGGMKASEFIDRCKQAGVKYKQVKGGAHCLQNAGTSIKFSRATKQMDGPVIRMYLRKLQLNELHGVGVEEFMDGTSDDREQIYRYIAALKRLAKT